MPPLLPTLAALAVVGLSWVLLSTGGTDGPPLCLFHRATGHPCPTCGVTRAGVALLHGRVQSALTFNPLFTLAVLAATPFAILHYAFGLALDIRLGRRARRRLWALLAAALLANWLWLLRNGV